MTKPMNFPAKVNARRIRAYQRLLAGPKGKAEIYVPRILARRLKSRIMTEEESRSIKTKKYRGPKTPYYGAA